MDKELGHKLNNLKTDQQQIIWLLRGNADLEIEGVIPVQKKMQTDVNELCKWRAELEKKAAWTKERNKLYLIIAGWISAMIGTAGAVLGLFQGLKLIFLWMN